MTRYEKIKEALDSMNTAELVNIHNNYCDASNNPDAHIYGMDEFDEVMSGMNPWDVARACFYGDFRPCDDYFCFNGYANLDSFDYHHDDPDADGRKDPIYTSDIASYIDDNDDALDCDEIQDILDEEDDDSDDE